MNAVLPHNAVVATNNWFNLPALLVSALGGLDAFFVARFCGFDEAFEDFAKAAFGASLKHHTCTAGRVGADDLLPIIHLQQTASEMHLTQRQILLVINAAAISQEQRDVDMATHVFAHGQEQYKILPVFVQAHVHGAQADDVQPATMAVDKTAFAHFDAAALGSSTTAVSDTDHIVVLAFAPRQPECSSAAAADDNTNATAEKEDDDDENTTAAVRQVVMPASTKPKRASGRRTRQKKQAVGDE